ncbi:MAG: hypothetical protein JXO72_03820 [Vicinamibacteria bacterium]|nr:hypothetical protein [Vicinamibacteria bacterium]
MDSVLDQARGGQNLLERIVNHIPGFKGYREKELRRDADRIERERLSSRLELNKKALDDLADGATRSGALDLINEIETARKRIDKIVARVRYADRGYAGFFDAVKVDETVLARIYEFDLGLIENADQIRAAAQAAADAPSGLKAVLRTLIETIDALDARLAEREAVLAGVR